MQRVIPALPPRILSGLLRIMGIDRVAKRAFSWYLNQAHPALATLPAGSTSFPLPLGRPSASIVCRR
jgi:hypothetical protein